MSYTSPATWSPGQLVASTDLNTQVRDNFLAIAGTTGVFPSPHMTSPVVDSGGLTVTSGVVNMGASSVVAGLGVLGNGATDGFLYVSSGGGVPSGVPTTQGSNVAIRFNTADLKLYAYVAGNWHTVQFV